DKARSLIAAAGAQLPAGIPANFAELLFGRTAPEDLLACSAADLARLAQDAWEFFAERQPGRPKMRVQSPGDRLSSISVIEIVNDDKPFLLDSTMDELTELGVEVRLVAHPVLRVVRDPAGRASGLAAAGARGSFTPIHVGRIDDEGRKAKILSGLDDVLAEVQLAVADWKPMLARVGEVIADLVNQPPPLAVDEIAEAIE